MNCKILLLTVLIVSQVMAMRVKLGTSLASDGLVTLGDCTTTAEQRATVKGTCQYDIDPQIAGITENTWKAAAYCDKQAGKIGLYEDYSYEYYDQMVGAQTDMVPNAQDESCSLAYAYGHFYNDESPNEEEAC
jgi:hypothetical protein